MRGPGNEKIVLTRLLPPGYSAMTLGKVILVRPEFALDRELLAHELIHVRQWRDLGKIRFLWLYLGGYLKGRLRGLGHREAYEQIPLEVEARELSRG